MKLLLVTKLTVAMMAACQNTTRVARSPADAVFLCLDHFYNGPGVITAQASGAVLVGCDSARATYGPHQMSKLQAMNPITTGTTTPRRKLLLTPGALRITRHAILKLADESHLHPDLADGMAEIWKEANHAWNRLPKKERYDLEATNQPFTKS